MLPVVPPERPDLVRAFRDRLKAGDLAQLELRYQLVGRRVDERVGQLLLRPDGHARLTGPAGGAGMNLVIETDHALYVFKALAEVLDELTPRSKADFLPGSEIGMISVQLDERREDFFFLTEREDRDIQDKPLSSAAVDALARLQRLAQFPVNPKAD